MNRHSKKMLWLLVGVIAGLSILIMTAGCATSVLTNKPYIEKEMAVGDLNFYMTTGYYRYKIVKARCVATVKAKYPWSCYYDGKWYWMKDGVGMLQNDRTGYY